MITAVLAGVPNGAEGPEWDGVSEGAAEAIAQGVSKMTFSAKNLESRRGKFASCSAGYSFGGGRETVGNVRIEGKKNREVFEGILKNENVERIAGFTNNMFNTFAHKPYMEYKETAEALQAHHPHLRPTSPKTVFAATTINMGPRSFSPPHVDKGNNAGGWCVVTALGPFNPDKGGHFVLWDLKLAVRFPPGASILFPSALVTHSNIPILEDEKRYSIIQYSAGALFRWRYNGFKSDKAFLASATQDQLAKQTCGLLY
ncbi:hypothetical protein BT96DRAFT_959100 [Gymnopus androsaceus JB14]|uniref:Prolyl 4-hydroxylase alpha subunit Fe(2+) 2OG dioxygenase domain-containing protein n=1 Tax=Gymnopus androsaceus JB14 TaxID=1447944 RepID=A0A6A4H6H3_9AGAR|nr:hypothetical protein BT96DRAFT_959100 [Gymnopus androsaceus JB14]